LPHRHIKAAARTMLTRINGATFPQKEDESL
jgi:hypothetical protein